MKSVTAWLPLALLLAAPAPEPKDAGLNHVIPGGVADADGAKGFVADDKGFVAALDLESGKVLWESKTAGRPIAVAGGRVLVQTADPKNAHALRIVGLDVAKGDKTWESDPIVFPDWASPVEGRWAGRTFDSRARRDDGALLIRWQASTFYWGGAAPSPEIVKAAMRHADGVARIDLDSGKVEMLDTAKAPPAPAGRFSKEQLEKAAATFFPNAPANAGKLSVVGDLAVALELEMGGAKAVLKRYDLARDKPLDPVVLAEGGPYDATRMIETAVLIHRKGGAAWDVYSVEGKSLGTIPDEPGAANLTIVGPRAFYMDNGPRPTRPFGGVLPRTLKAVDLKSAKSLWEQPLEGERLPPPPPP